MKTCEELMDLFESIGKDTSIKNLKKHQVQINNIVEQIETTKSNKNVKEQLNNECNEIDAEECYSYMVLIILEGLNVEGVINLMLPIIADKLNETTLIEIK